MQLVDLAYTFGMLQVPHPLLPDHKNFRGSIRRTRVSNIEAGRPEKYDDADECRNPGPQDFEWDIFLDFRRYLIFRLPPVLDHEEENRGEDHHRKKERNCR